MARTRGLFNRSEPKVDAQFAAPEEEDKLVAWLDKKVEQGKSMLPDQQMRLNLSYTLGQQWVVWDDRTRLLRRPTERPDDPTAPVRITINKIGEIVEQAVAEIVQRKPIPEVRPVSDEEDDLNAARVGNRILRHELERVCWDDILLDGSFWTVPLGWSYFQVTWNAEDGPVVGELESEDGKDAETVMRGEVEIEEVPTWELAVDPNAKRFSQARWAVRTVAMTKEAVWEKWGVVPDGASTSHTLMDDVQNITDESWSKRTKNPAEHLEVHQFWLRPGSRIRPEGMVVTWCGRTILEKPRPFPYTHGRLPFAQWTFLPGIGRREGRTWVDDLLSMQNDYNDARSREATIRRTLTPKVYAPVGSIDPKRLRARLELVTYNPVGEKPYTDLPDGRWMAQYEAGMNRADLEMQDRASIHGVSKGQAPQGRNAAAAAIIALQEADDIGFVIPNAGLKSAIREIGYQVLMLVHQFWTEERLVRTWSEEDGAMEVYHYQGADLTEQIDVGIDEGSANIRSKAARAALARELRQQFPGDVDLPTYLRMLEMPGLDFVVQRIDKDVKQARRHVETMYASVLEKMEAGVTEFSACIIPVETWHNHYIHLREFGEFMKTPEWEELPEAAQDVFRARYETHLQQAGPQLQSPLPPGTPTEAQLMSPGKAPGRSPTISQLAGMSGAGLPGRSPQVPVDAQARSMGT